MKTSTLLLLSVAPALACQRSADPVAPATTVRVQVLGHTQDDQRSRYSATVEPATRVDLAFKLGGYVDRVARVKGSDGKRRLVQEGDRVTQGTELAALRGADFTNRLAEARAAMAEAKVARDQARLDFERVDKLLAGTAVPKAQWDAARARLDATEARVLGATAVVAEATTLVSDASLRAPFSGTIARRNLEVGALAAPGIPVFTVTDTESVKVVFGVPDSVRDRLHTGDTLPVLAETLPDRSFDAKITRVAAIADPRSRVFEVELTLPNADHALKPGTVVTVKVDAPAGQTTPPLLPLSAIVRSRVDSSHFAVFVLDESATPPVVRQRDVELGEFMGNSIPVRNGLPDKAKVVVQGAALLSDGERVQVLP
jgi:multidrug efflux system membrane fusion protein